MEQLDRPAPGTVGSPPSRQNGHGASPAGSPSPEEQGSAPRNDRSPEPHTRRAGVPSARPALLVVVIAAGLLLLFGVGSALTGSSTPPKPSTSAGAPVKGTTLRSEPASGRLHAIERPGTPPADVLQSLVLPAGTVTVSAEPWDGETQFNGEMAFRSSASQGAVVSFYRAELRAKGWSISSVGPARDQAGATEVLAQRSSTDGWYWGVGVVVSPTTFPNGATSDSTHFTVDLFQEPETD